MRQRDEAKRVPLGRGLLLRFGFQDGGPMAHPIRPDSYSAIDNFYTPTVCAHHTRLRAAFRPPRRLECAAASTPARDKQQRRTALFVTVRSIQPRAAAKAKANAPLPTAEIDRFDSPLPFATLDESNPVRTALSAPHGTGLAHARRVCACSAGTLGSVGCAFQL